MRRRSHNSMVAILSFLAAVVPPCIARADQVAVSNEDNAEDEVHGFNLNGVPTLFFSATAAGTHQRTVFESAMVNGAWITNNIFTPDPSDPSSSVIFVGATLSQGKPYVAIQTRDGLSATSLTIISPNGSGGWATNYQERGSRKGGQESLIIEVTPDPLEHSR